MGIWDLKNPFTPIWWQILCVLLREPNGQLTRKQLIVVFGRVVSSPSSLFLLRPSVRFLFFLQRLSGSLATGLTVLPCAATWEPKVRDPSAWWPMGGSERGLLWPALGATGHPVTTGSHRDSPVTSGAAPRGVCSHSSLLATRVWLVLKCTVIWTE